MICFFIGHRDAEWSIMPQLESVIRKHIIDYGVAEFVVGQYGTFDRMAAKAVISAKKELPKIKLTALLPYLPTENAVKIPEGYDRTFYPPDLETVPKRLAIVRANQYMIRHSDCLIAYAWQPGSNSRRLTEQARRQKNLMVTELHK